MQIFPNETIANFLNIVLVDNMFIYLDLWSIVHFFTGLALMLLLLRFIKPVQATVYFLGLIFLYEIFEVLFYGSLFRWESNLNIIWDLIVGVLGGSISIIYYIKNGKK
jgi:hypothetical protein